MKIKITEKTYTKAAIVYALLILILPLLFVLNNAIKLQSKAPNPDGKGESYGIGPYMCYTFSNHSISGNDHCKFSELFMQTAGSYILMLLFAAAITMSAFSLKPLGILFAIGNVIIFFGIAIFFTFLEKRKQKNKL